MGLFDYIADDLEGVTRPAHDAPVCAECKRDRGELVEMQARQSWQPGSVLDTWRCPECGHEVVRGDGDNERWV